MRSPGPLLLCAAVHVTLIATLTAKPGRLDDLVELVRWMVGQAQAEAGTEVYAGHVDADQNAVWLYEVYRDEAALAVHSASDAMRQFVDALHEVAEPDMIGRRLEPIASTGLPG
jgi:quinol monooxygenase YgiN